MGAKTHIVSKFAKHDGKLITDSGASVTLGGKANDFSAYELLLGGLSHCLFSTYESLAEKMKVEYDGMDMSITGIKRDEKVATLKTVDIEVLAKGIVDQDKFTKAFETATRYCSIFNTLAQIAEMRWNITFA
jgi:putative redox protein